MYVNLLANQKFLAKLELQKQREKMKHAIIIWTTVLILGAITFVYVNNALNYMSKEVKADDTAQVQPAKPINLGNDACLQNCNPVQLQGSR